MGRLTEELPLGLVYACPRCGKEVLFSCHHDGVQVSSKRMTGWDAEKLRWESGEYEARTYVCDSCDVERPFEAGMQLGISVICPLCVAEAADGD
jgi:uncharacterized protein (DUF983 family)